MMQQGLDLHVKPHIVISTPGRLADHLDSCNTFSLKRIKFLVSSTCLMLQACGSLMLNFRIYLLAIESNIKATKIYKM